MIGACAGVLQAGAAVASGQHSQEVPVAPYPVDPAPSQGSPPHCGTAGTHYNQTSMVRVVNKISMVLQASITNILNFTPIVQT